MGAEEWHALAAAIASALGSADDGRIDLDVRTAEVHAVVGIRVD